MQMPLHSLLHSRMGSPIKFICSYFSFFHFVLLLLVLDDNEHSSKVAATFKANNQPTDNGLYKLLTSLASSGSILSRARSYFPIYFNRENFQKIVIYFLAFFPIHFRFMCDFLLFECSNADARAFKMNSTKKKKKKKM